MTTSKSTASSGVDDNNKTHPKGVDEHNQNVVAQGSVTTLNKGNSAYAPRCGAKKLRCTPCYGRLALASRVHRSIYFCFNEVYYGYRKSERIV